MMEEAMRILAVDDEKYALAALTDAIKEASPSSEVYACRAMDEALELIESCPCDVAFLDIKLRGATGLELGLRLKRVCPYINIIFVTGYDDYVMEAVRQRCSGYLMKPVRAEQVAEELANLRYPVAPMRSYIHAHTFGNFELFAGDRAVTFETSRSKELLAFLIDRRGAFMTVNEIEAVIWEENENIYSAQAQVRKAKASLIRSLKQVRGAEEILLTESRSMAVDRTKMSCDYWQLLDNDVRVLNSFTGEYMNEYSWAEPTRAELLGRSAAGPV